MNASFLTYLKKVNKEIDSLYAYQITPGVLYPSDTSKETLIEESKKNPDIRNPYTVVQKKGSSYEAISYTTAFRTQLVRIASFLEQASSASDDKKIQRFLIQKAQALLEGKYIQSEKEWLLLPVDLPYSISLGPLLSYHDDVLGVKRFYSSCISAVDIGTTRIFSDIMTYGAAYAKTFPDKEITIPSLQRVQVSDVICWGGEAAEMKPVAWARPNGENTLPLVHQYGGVSLLFSNMFRKRARTSAKKLLRAVFGDAVVKAYTKDIVFLTMMGTLLHELGHVYGTIEGINDRAKEYFMSIDELKADVFALRQVETLYQLGNISRSQRDAMYICLLGDYLSQIGMSLTIPARKHHAWSGVVIFRTLIEKGAITVSSSSVKFDVSLFPSVIEALFDTVIRLTYNAAYKDFSYYVSSYKKSDARWDHLLHTRIKPIVLS